MSSSTIISYTNGKAYVVKVSRDVAEKFGLAEGKEVPNPVLLHLVYTDKAEVYDSKGNKLDFEDLIKLIEDLETFSTFIVLHDLAKKGKKISIGVNIKELLLPDDNIKIYILDEDSYISAEDLYKLVDKTIKQDYKLVIAVVDVNGEITYYEVNKMDFPRLEKR